MTDPYQDVLTAKMHLELALQNWDAPDSTLPTNPVLLDVPYSSQHERDAREYSLDCGAACIEMLGEFYRGQVAGIGTDQIHEWMTGGRNTTTSKEQLIKAASHFYGVDLEHYYNTSNDQLRSWLNEGKPAIVLVRYGDFPMRMDRNYVSGHWMVVVGYDSYNWAGETVRRLVVHDPNWWSVAMGQGAYLPVVETVFNGMFVDYRRLALVAQ